MAAKRRLPLLPADPGAEDEPPRPSWQWVFFGALAIGTTWLPLSAVAGLLAARLAAKVGGAGGDSARGDSLAATGLAIVAIHAGAIALGSFAGGFVVGRWGARGVGVRESALAGLAAALVAVGGAWVSSGFDAAALVVVAVAGPSAAAGGSRGLRARARGP